MPIPAPSWRLGNANTIALAALLLGLLFLSGCATRIGTDRVTSRQAYAQGEANALRTGKPSLNTVAILHRFDLDRLASRQPDETVCRLHQKALATGERDLLFALAEISFLAGRHVDRRVKPWDSRDARDYYLGSAVYAWLYLFGEGKDALLNPFDRRTREACDLYNYSLGLALTERKSTNGVVQLHPSQRRLPVGQVELRLDLANFPTPLKEFDEVLLADQFRVHGLRVRNRAHGLGAPLLCVSPVNPEFGIRLCTPATVVLRGPTSLAELDSGPCVGPLELYSAFDHETMTLGTAHVPLEIDLTTFRAYTLDQSRVWNLGKRMFLAPTKQVASQLIPNQPFEPDRIPVVFVHGTFSSPITWTEMANTLTADPVLRRRYQFWSFAYGSGNPLVYSVADLRSALTAEIQRLDPPGTNAVLRQMVVVGHSQGGLLAKGTVVEVGDRIWRQFSTNELDDLRLTEQQQAEVRRLLFPEPLPFVKRVVFIATPHRGSYRAGGLVRRLAHLLVSLPGTLVSRGADILRVTAGSDTGRFMGGKLPTSLDGMSPKNPGLLAVAEIPVVPSVKAHSIIPVLREGDYQRGRDGIVTYPSAHVDYVKSELVVHSRHGCLKKPATIAEVRRILHEHLSELNENPSQTR